MILSDQSEATPVQQLPAEQMAFSSQSKLRQSAQRDHFFIMIGFHDPGRMVVHQVVSMPWHDPAPGTAFVKKGIQRRDKSTLMKTKQLSGIHLL